MQTLMFKNNSTPIPTDRKGIYPVGTEFHHNGAPIRGIGVNHWGSFINELSPLGVPSNFNTDLTAIKQTWGLPFVRVAVGMYSRSTWVNQWKADKATFYAKLDEYVAKAESLNLGIVAVLVWGPRGFTDSCFDTYGEFNPVKNLAYKHTQAWQLFEEFVTEIVTRYKDSPAIWAWELGNEVVNSVGAEYHYSWKLDGTGTDGGGTALPENLNWGTRPSGGSYQPTDKMSMAEWQRFSAEFVALVNRLDENRRAIMSGSPIGNSFAVQAQTSDTLAADFLTQWDGTTAATEFLPWVRFRDKAFNCITQHIYPMKLNDGRFFNGAEKSQAELITLSQQWADQVGLPHFLGEWGATCYGDLVDEISTTPAEEQANFSAALNAVVTAQVPLSAVWNYGGSLTGPSPWMRWHLTDPARIYQLEAIAAASAVM